LATVVARVVNVSDLPYHPRGSGISRRSIARDAPAPRPVIGRQAIFDRERRVFGYELLFRAPGRLNLRIDLWNFVAAGSGDRARPRRGVLSRGGNVRGPAVVCQLHPDLPSRHVEYLHSPSEIVLEVVESAHADRSLYERLSDLKNEGYRVAIDDFVGRRASGIFSSWRTSSRST